MMWRWWWRNACWGRLDYVGVCSLQKDLGIYGAPRSGWGRSCGQMWTTPKMHLQNTTVLCTQIKALTYVLLRECKCLSRKEGIGWKGNSTFKFTFSLPLAKKRPIHSPHDKLHARPVFPFSAYDVLYKILWTRHWQIYGLQDQMHFPKDCLKIAARVKVVLLLHVCQLKLFAKALTGIFQQLG